MTLNHKVYLFHNLSLNISGVKIRLKYQGTRIVVIFYFDLHLLFCTNWCAVALISGISFIRVIPKSVPSA